MLPYVATAGASLTFSPKSPSDYDEFQVDFSYILAPLSGSLTGVPSVTPTPSGITINQINQTSGVVSFYASGGVNGTNYTITVSVQTNISPTGQILNRSVILPVLNR